MFRSLKLPHLALLAVSFVALHAICVIAFRAQATVATYPFLLLAPSIATALSCWRAVRARPGARSRWALLSAGMGLWTCGIFLSAWEDFFQHAPLTTAWFSDFSFFLYGAPLLLAISTASDNQRIPFFLWMDVVQTLLAAFLVYVSIFSVMPLSGAPPVPLGVSVLVWTYNAENLLLAVAASLRLLAEPRGSRRGFYAIVFYFLWLYAIAAYIYNSRAAAELSPSVADALVDVPFLFLAVAIARSRLRDDATDAPAHRHLLPLFIESVSPIFYTLALLALSVSLIDRHFFVGTAGIFTALAVYATRSTLLQLRYILTQRKLHDARERLERMALTDALTTAANRRRFDETLILEWNRAVRNRHPLALLLIDVDYFKKLNDRYGHPAGDRCLVAMAIALQSSLPGSGDLLARYGGEEFAAILPATDEAGAYLTAVAMQDAVRLLQIPNETATGPFVTVSVGIAVLEAPQVRAAGIVEAADQALYRAKQRGRNRIEVNVLSDLSDDGVPRPPESAG